MMTGQTLTSDKSEWSGNPTTFTYERLTADPRRWAEGPSSFTYQWQLCDKSGGSCKDIAGATGKTYGVRSGDKDNTIRVQVTAKNLVGSTTASSDNTHVVTAGTPTPTPTPVGVGGAISITAVSLPNRLIVSQIQFTPRVGGGTPPSLGTRPAGPAPPRSGAAGCTSRRGRSGTARRS